MKVATTGFGDDDEYQGTFEWWRHRTGLIVAVRLDRAGQITGVGRPITQDDLQGSPKGFAWDEAPGLVALLEAIGDDFKKIGNRAKKDVSAQRPELSDEDALLTL